MAVHFTGPILHAGTQKTREWFLNLPASNNPDYVTYMDDFTGVVVLSSQATTDNDGASIQGNEIYALSSTKDIWFETKLFVTDAEGSNTDVCVGLTVNFATNPEAMLTAADRIVFQIDDGDSNIDCVTEKDGTATTTDSGVDIVSGTYVTLGFHVSGTSKVEFFVNRNLVATHTDNLPDDENLTIGAMELSGSATGTKSMTIDYLMTVKNR